MDEDKDNFYDQLQVEVDTVHKHDMLIMMGDLNVKVGESNDGHVMGSHGLGEKNNNGESLRLSIPSFHISKVLVKIPITSPKFKPLK